MALFIKKNNGGIFNATLVQNIVLDTNTNTITIRFKNGEEFKEEYLDIATATTRYEALWELVLSIGGGSSKEIETLKEIIEVQSEQIADLENTVTILATEISDAEKLSAKINGEEV